ncbi:MAG: YybS family protein [Treponema sp.]|jgi:hypothetical protein|nr:YybS family protein [Treponema sp.]
MFPRREGLPQRPAPLPALAGALICLVLVKSGFLAPLFLVPLGVLAYSWNSGTAWVSAAFVLLGNGIYTLGTGLFWRRDSGFPAVSSPGELPAAFLQTLPEWLYLTVMVLGFTWLTAPLLRKGRGRRIPAVYRLTAASVAGALAVVPVLRALKNDNGIYQLLRSQAEAAVSLYASSPDAAVQSLLERISPEWILETLGSIALRGGAAASCMALFYFNRQAALILTWFIRKTRPGGGIVRFHTDFWLIWVFSFAFLGVLGGTVWRIPPLEIGAWNILVLCAILYLAQGAGILLYFLSRLAMPPFLRFLVHFLIILVLFSPKVNVFALGALALLGVAENWVPFRALHPNGSSSTPGT